MVEVSHELKQSDARHEPRQQPARARAVLEDVIRELEFEGSERWAPLIERLRGVLDGMSAS